MMVRVYTDALSPAVQNVGQTLARAVRVALRPVEGVLWTLEEAFDWVGDRVAERLKMLKVSPDDITRPPVDVEGRVLVGLQSAGPSSDPLLRNLFAALLATSMGPSPLEAHPAMAETLRQLVPDEARILSLVAAKSATLVDLHVRAFWIAERVAKDREAPDAIAARETLLSKSWFLLAEELKIENRECEFYLDHLTRLGLVGRDRSFELPQKRAYPTTVAGRALTECKQLIQQFSASPPREIAPRGLQWRTSIRTEISGLQLTPWGNAFVRSTGAAEFYDTKRRTFVLPTWAA